MRALQLIREEQAAGAIGMRVEEDKAKGATGVLFFRRDDVSADILEKGAEVRRLLKLPAETQRFVLTYSPGRGADNELAVNSGSMLQIMGAFASYLDVPEAHRKEHRAVPALEHAATETRQDKVRIYSGKDKPVNAFAAVQYRDYWFWIDDGDWQTKRALTAVMFFFTLAENRRQREAAPDHHPGPIVAQTERINRIKTTTRKIPIQAVVLIRCIRRRGPIP